MGTSVVEAAGGLIARIRRLPWWRFCAGMVAGSTALVLTFVLRVLRIGVFLPEIALDFAITRIPGSIESAFIGTLGGGAKLLGLSVSVIAVLAAYGVGALLFRRIQRTFPSRWRVWALYGFVSSGVILLVLFPLLGAGLAGSETDVGFGLASFSQLLGGLLYGSVVDYFLIDFASRHPAGFSPSRRTLLLGGAAAIAGFALAVYGFGSLVTRPARLLFASIAELLSKEITPTDEFYVVTKNLIDPTVDASSWRLVIDGRVSTPLLLGYSDLQMRTATEEFATLECVSNEVGGNLISTAKWSGLRLSDLLNEAGVQPEASWIEFTCADGYTAAIPLSKALDPATLLVLKMNDAPLGDRHGFPARILVPGKYGMFSAKWITRITAIPNEARGFWQQKGWTNAGLNRTTAIITTPAPESVVGASVSLGGIAFAGDRGTSMVEVSTDDGRSWHEAVLRPPLDPRLTWVLWTYDWNPPASGAYRVQVRATDGNGVAQEPGRAPPFPDGSSGYDSITLYVNR